MQYLFLIISAIIIDLIIGDPHYPFHPIRLIGLLISRLEKLLLGKKFQFFSGIVLVSLTITITYCLSFIILYYTKIFNEILHLIISIYLIYSILAIKCLIYEANKIYKKLKENDITKARQYLSYLVSRDTNDISEKEIIRGTVETVAENFVDAIIAPLFYLFLGGIPLALLYKAVNTLDSMVGYKNDRYKKFGWASAKLDDLLNFIPARLSAFIIIPIAGIIYSPRIKKVYKIVFRDRLNHDSPNSAHSEAAFAGVLDIQMGGPTSYFGKLHQKPTIGDKIKDFEIEDIKKANNLLLLSTINGLLIFSVIWFLTNKLINNLI